ncbi:LON peptidase substrate-binding domain-containing protein [Actinomadura oligospora]|uniref:LON peptidase substrate-binding domain-containing protein n=1 Tax=Actinomadura oligospora TaxID=111804 RepID=UPI00047A43C5|nr:LON peptidase substrate-binding domain-containing protein [Actinomadura oligospora]
MTDRIALFPLSAVLFPGVVLPLHLFEERYRTLLADLMDGPEPRRFGVVALEHGRETAGFGEPGVPGAPGPPEGGPDGSDAPDGIGPPAAPLRLAEIGCVAELHEVVPLPEGRFDVVTVGGRRFRLKELDRSRPYLCGDVEFLPEEPGAAGDDLVRRVRRLFHLYRHRLAAAGADAADPAELPDDPVALSYLVAAATVLDPADKQRLLAAEDAAHRLRAERDLLLRETRLLDALPTVPAGQFLDASVHPN